MSCETGGSTVATGKNVRTLLRGAAPEDGPEELQPYEGESDDGHELAPERDRAGAEAAQDEQTRGADRTATAQSEHDAAGEREHGDGARDEVRLSRQLGHFAPALDGTGRAG
ncbi:hypothetical protein [Streptomyces sp. NPDC059272]|uniref:hypothetical protein n=1 Tax=Streptomyces sp. NPDC059272 TaxID=3346800 RepID=UPI0036A0D21F